MLRGSLIFVLILSFTQLVGQYTIEHPEMPDRRNSIGINLTPVVIVMMNSESFSPRFSVTYKRQQDINRKMRFQLNYEIRENYEEDISQGEVLFFTDTTIVRQINDAFHIVSDFRIGMEWFKPERPTTMIYGIDLFAGIATEQDGYRIIPQYVTEGIIVPSPFEAPLRYSQEITYFLVGFDFSIGHKFNASEKVNFILRWTPQVAYRTPISETYSDLTLREQPATSSAYFRLRGIELYLNYQF